jgi:hypothetical protein
VWRSRLGTILVWSFALLLVATIVHRAILVSDALGRLGPDRTTFARVAKPLPGTFGPVMIKHRSLLDIACARNRPRAYKLCVTINAGRVLQINKTPS